MILFYIALFIITLIATYVVRHYFYRHTILDIPNARSAHSLPTPRGGGFAFVVFFYISLAWFWYRGDIHNPLFFALLGGLIVAFIGFLDDLYHVPPIWRISMHTVASIWGLSCLGGLSSIWLGDATWSSSWLFLLGVLTTLWVINLYNFMDGIDGIATVEGISVALSLCVLLKFHADILPVLYTLIAVLLGFLVWNWPPAKIFMGDIGSGFLGYIFAIMMWHTNITRALPLPVWFILFAVFLGDASFTLMHRLKRKKRWYDAHNEHLYQRLARTGMSHTQVTTGIFFINLAILLPAAKFYTKIPSFLLESLYAGSIFLLCWIIWYTLLRKTGKFMES